MDGQNTFSLGQRVKASLGHLFRGGWRNDFYYAACGALMALLYVVLPLRSDPGWWLAVIAGAGLMLFLLERRFRPREGWPRAAGWGWIFTGAVVAAVWMAIANDFGLGAWLQVVLLFAAVLGAAVWMDLRGQSQP